MNLSTGVINSFASHFGTIFNGGVLYVFAGSAPVSADAAIDVVATPVLGQLTVDGAPYDPGSGLNGLIFQQLGNGQVVKPENATWKFTALASGRATWFRLMAQGPENLQASSAAARIDGSIGRFSGDLIMETVDLVAGNDYVTTFFRFAFPAREGL